MTTQGPRRTEEVQNLHGRTALVTGAARRIGRAVSLRLAGEGINIVFTYRRSAREAGQTARDLQKKGVRTLAIRADLTDLKACNRVVEKVNSEFAKVDILVNNASDFSKTDLVLLDQDSSAFEAQFNNFVRLHMMAPFYLGLRLGLAMKRNGWGRIINITDRVTLKGQAYRNWSLYLASKYGLYGVTQVLAVELSPEVTVNSIAPGLVVPPSNFTARQIQKLRETIPLKREAGMEAIAEDVLHLVRSDSKTGSVILTDGGSGLATF